MTELDPEAAAYLEATAAYGFMPLDPVEARRYTRARSAELGGPPVPVAQVEDRTIPGPAGPLAIRVYTPEGEPPFPALAFFHGGGWVTGDLDTHDSACRGLAAASGCVVVAVDFRCAPEHPFPAAVEDSWALVEWLSKSGPEVGADPDRLAVGGDSAGGNLAAVMALRARDRGVRLGAQILAYPVLDRDFERPSYLAKASGFGLTRDAMRWYWRQYAGEGDELSPEAAPLRAPDLSGLAPALVITCEHDTLHDEGAEYVRRLAAAGVRVEHVDEPGMIHGHLRMAGVIARARKSWEDCARFLRRELAQPG